MNALALWKDLDSLTDSLWGGFGNTVLRNGFYPRVDVTEKNDRYELTADLPGFGKDDVKVQIKDGVLELSADKTVETPQEKTTDETEVRWLLRERRQASFSRTFRLPRDVDAESIEAQYKDGLLVLTLPKKEEAKPRQVTIKVA